MYYVYGLGIYKVLALRAFNYFVAEVPVIYKPVHWFVEQINELFSI